MKNYKFCQSCSMPMDQDPEKDGSKSLKYCSYCYKNGEFISPEIDTAEKKQEQGMSKFIAWIFTRGIPRLERWKE